jgi:ATP:ADP antiporter, AAA family
MTSAGPAGSGDNRSHGTTPTHRVLERMVDVREGEVRAMLMSAAFFFFVLSGYFILRPIRDELAVASGVRGLPNLFLMTLGATLLLNPLFSALVVRLPVRTLMATTYHLVAASMLMFYVLRGVTGPGDEIWLGRAFFVWTTVIALFVTSVFWSFMADRFRSEQAKRLFGFIGVGGTLGSITGSGLTATLAERLGTSNLLLLSAVLFEAAVMMIWFFPRQAPAAEDAAERVHGRTTYAEKRPIGGTAWAGITALLRSRYLLGAAAFIMLYTIGSTIIYSQQTEIFGVAFTDRAQRTSALAQMEMATQILTVLTQTFLTGRIIRWIGLGATLAIMPALSAFGFAALGTAPSVAAIVVFSVLRRGTNFSLTNPSMEALFTVVNREDKYKAKSFIETFVYRGGDQLGIWGYSALSRMGMSLRGISYLAVPLCILWLTLGLWLGRRQARLAGAADARLLPELEPEVARVG